MSSRIDVLNKRRTLGGPRWLWAAAIGAFVVTIPSALWRVAMIVGAVPGTAALRRFELAGNPALGYSYVFGLSVVQLATAYLVIGLVRPWGERFAGHRVPIVAPVIAGLAGGIAVTWLFDIRMVTQIAHGVRPDEGLTSGAALAVMVACYAPILLWGPLTIAATLGYAWRRTRGLTRDRTRPVAG